MSMEMDYLRMLLTPHARVYGNGCGQEDPRPSPLSMQAAAVANGKAPAAAGQGAHLPAELGRDIFNEAAGHFANPQSNNKVSTDCLTHRAACLSQRKNYFKCAL